MVKKETKSVSRKKTSVLRPPVVAVLGHVDHGKTTLLDAIRKASVADSEAGGITQHIGAYQVEHQGKKITFIDTPGHVAFSQMRSRGVGVADLVVLVVALDEGVKPQTLESLKHIRSAKVPFLVALTKADLPSKDIQRVKKDLSAHGVLLEKRGGDIVAVPVSGKTGQGIKDLLEMILILAEMNELKGSKDNPFKGVVIESKLDPRRGHLATILVRDGSLGVGDEVVVEGEVGKVKAMFDERGKVVSLAFPSTPVGILGFKVALAVGMEVKKVEGELSSEKPDLAKEVLPSAKAEDDEEEGKRLKVILKADTLGTLEAILGSFPDKVQMIYSGVGGVSGSDVLLAETTGSWLVAFGVKTFPAARKLAETEKVKIDTFKIIYELLEQLEKKILRLMEPTIDEQVLGKAQVLETFEIKKERIAGLRVLEGEIVKNGRFHLERKGEIVGDCRLKSLKRGKIDIEKVKKGDEFGAIFSPQLDFDVGDMLISFRKVEEP